MSNITIHPATAANPVLLGHLQTATNSIATINPGQRYATLVQQTPPATPSRTWLRAIGRAALRKEQTSA